MTSEPFSPSKTEPDPGSGNFSGRPSASRGGNLPSPSYQVTLIGLPVVISVPGNSYETVDHFVQTSRLMGGASARIVTGAVSFRAIKTGSRMWQPKSPSWPFEKSCQARQLNGWYTSALYGRSGATPSQSSQWTVGGTGSAPGGRSSTSRHRIRPDCHETTSFTFPMTP